MRQLLHRTARPKPRQPPGIENCLLLESGSAMLTKGILLKLQLFPKKKDVRRNGAQGKMRGDGSTQQHESTLNTEPPYTGGRLAISRPPEERVLHWQTYS
jgi:hypothetical protein